MGEQIKINTEEHRSTVLHRLNEMRETIEGCDSTIKVGSKEIYAHMCVLIAGSDYFRGMFSHDTKEKQTGIVTIMEAEPTCVEKCIEFIYTGIPPELEDDIEPLMDVACLMELSTLRDGIIELLNHNLNLESFCVTWRIADRHWYDCKQLLKKCHRFALMNIEEITELEGFVHLDKICIEKLLDSRLNGITENMKLHALLSWVKFDIENRDKVMNVLLNFIKFEKVHLLGNLIENEPLLKKINGLKFFLNADFLKFEKFFSTSYTITSDGNLEFGAKTPENSDRLVIFDKISGHLRECNPSNNNWMCKKEMNEVMMKQDFSAVYVKNYIYVLQNKSVYRFNCLDVAVAWKQVKGLSDDHGSFPPVIVMKSCIYVIGGHYGISTKSVEKYDTSSGTWTKLGDKPQASQCSTPVALNDQIYCCGGIDAKGEYTNAVIRFNSDFSVGNSVAPMNEARSSIAAVAFDGKLYALGGFNGTYCATMESFDPIKNSWTLLKSMNTTRSWCRSFEITGEIYAVGGYTNRNDIEKYNPEENVWVDVKMPGKMEILESVKIIVKPFRGLDLTF